MDVGADATLSQWRTRLDERGRPAATFYYYDSITPGRAVEARCIPPELTASRPGSSTRRLCGVPPIDSYLTCAFQFFAHYTLRLGEMEEEMDGPDAAPGERPP